MNTASCLLAAGGHAHGESFCTQSVEKQGETYGEAYAETYPISHAEPFQKTDEKKGEENDTDHSGQPLVTNSSLPSDYTPFSLSVQPAWQALYAALPTHPLAYSLPNLWAWKEWMQLEVCFAHGLGWLRCERHGTHYLAPTGAWETIQWKALQALLCEMESIYQVPEPLARMWEAQLDCTVRVIENRDYWEYLYTTEDLANLAGSRYHMQRNHVNAFVREYGECDVRPLGSSDAPAMLELADLWLAEATPTPTTNAERVALERVCAAWNELGVSGLGLYLPDGLAAFSIGHRLDDSTLGVMFEKARPGLRGGFPAMTRSFARTVGQGYALLNRAEDMGEAGMRKAKTLYRPVDFQRMCTVYIGEN